MTGADDILAPGTKVKLWVGLTIYGYPPEGTIKQYIEDYPGGPTYEVEFPPNDFVPLACLKPEWVFVVSEDMKRDAADRMQRAMER